MTFLEMQVRVTDPAIRHDEAKIRAIVEEFNHDEATTIEDRARLIDVLNALQCRKFTKTQDGSTQAEG